MNGVSRGLFTLRAVPDAGPPWRWARVSAGVVLLLLLRRETRRHRTRNPSLARAAKVSLASSASASSSPSAGLEGWRSKKATERFEKLLARKLTVEELKGRAERGKKVRPSRQRNRRKQIAGNGGRRSAGEAAAGSAGGADPPRSLSLCIGYSIGGGGQPLSLALSDR